MSKAAKKKTPSLPTEIEPKYIQDDTSQKEISSQDQDAPTHLPEDDTSEIEGSSDTPTSSSEKDDSKIAIEKPQGQKKTLNFKDLASKIPNGDKSKRPLIVWVLLAVMIFTLFQVFTGAPGEGGLSSTFSPKTDKITQNIFWERAQKGEVKECKVIRNTDTDTVTLEGFFNNDKKKPFEVNVLDSSSLEEQLRQAGIQVTQENKSSFWGPVIFSILPIILLVALFYFFVMRKAQGGAMDFGKSRAKLMNTSNKKIHFSDVAGVEEAKEEVEEIVEFLKNPKKFEALGGQVPKGILLMGPPGTGKTLLAKAIAGEAEVPFFSISGSDFMEMFVGVGASRVRDMFEQGKRNSPCIIFIDEIDAIGRSRFTGIGGGHDEREQTLNAMLVEMDGFEANTGVIVMAATNRADVLDPALTRPGRFDRQIHVDLPTIDGRIAILQIHAKKLKLGEDVDLKRIARGTPGFSGADLANLLNEGALIAARGNKSAVEHDDLEEARDKVLWGRERKSRTMADRERRTTAWHEGGHALAQVICRHTEPLHKVTIIPRGRSLGATMSLPENDVLNRTRNEMKDILVVMCAGRIAEKLYTGDLSTGASSDIRMATNLARKMVCAYGMSKNFGFQAFGDNEDMVFLGRDMGRKQDHSEATARVIDEEVSQLIKEAYARCENLIFDNREKLEILVNYLLEVETADGRDVEVLVTTGHLPENPHRSAIKTENASTSEITDEVVASENETVTGETSTDEGVTTDTVLTPPEPANDTQ